MKQRAIIFVCVALAYACTFGPSQFVLRIGSKLLGNPKYEGWRGLFLPHLLLYSTLSAMVCALLWYGLYRAEMLPGLPLARTRNVFALGAVGGFMALGVAVPEVAMLFPTGTVHWIGFDPINILANFFSNFYEEFIFRGFMLTAITALIGFWPAAIISSAMWGAQHTQYPLALQVTIAATGVFWSWLMRRAKSFWTPYTAHMILDIIGDAIIP